MQVSEGINLQSETSVRRRNFGKGWEVRDFAIQLWWDFSSCLLTALTLDFYADLRVHYCFPKPHMTALRQDKTPSTPGAF